MTFEDREPTQDELALLALLSRGTEFTEAAKHLGVEEGIVASFACILEGWIDKGEITSTGRALVKKKLAPPKWEITVLPAPKTSSSL